MIRTIAIGIKWRGSVANRRVARDQPEYANGRQHRDVSDNNGALREAESLDRQSVDSGHRRAGHGRRVVEELIVRARRQLMHEILVFTDTPWTSAVALYRACGFVEIGRDDADTYLLLEL